jgi:hypothetical protein
MTTKLSKIERQVIHVLENYPQSRENDRILIARYLSIFHCIETFQEYLFSKKAPSMETLTRCRRKLQAARMYVASNPTIEQRMNHEFAIRNYLKGGKK